MSRTPYAARLAALATTATLALTLTACGGDDGSAPDAAGVTAPAASETARPADVVEFCEAYSGVVDDLSAITGTPVKQAAQAVQTMKSWTASMSALGTPASMPDDAVAGFEVLVGLIDDLDPDATLAELQSADTTLSDTDDASGAAFTAWITANCDPPGSTG